MDRDKTTDYLLDEKMKSRFNFDIWRNNRDFLTLQYPFQIGWYGRHPSNKLLSESYLLFRTIEFKLFRKKCMDYFLMTINNALQKISTEIGAKGEITVTNQIPNYENEWQRYTNGEISASELSDIIFRF